MVTDLDAGTVLTTAQAAALAGVSEKSIRNWIKAGQLPLVPSVEGRRIDKQALLDYLRDRAEAALTHLPPEARPDIVPDGGPELEARPDIVPGCGPEVEAPPPTSPESELAPETLPESRISPDLINIVLQPLREQLEQAQERLDRLHQENLELAGRVGFYQGRLHEFEQRVLLLEAPKGKSTPETVREPLPWWKRLFGVS